MTPKTSSKANREPGTLVKTYLLLYNFVQVIGWTSLLYIIVNFYTSAKKESLWENAKLIVVIFQNAAILEILHAMFRLVSSNVVMTIFQVFSRLMLVNGVLLATPSAPESPGVPLALIAWSFAEIIRYLFYALNIIGMVPSLLIWLRYTAFLVLYPMGVTGELLCLYAAQSYVATSQMWSVQFPNFLNFTFSYHYFLLFFMSLYIPLFPYLFLHMFGQRRKVLGGGTTSSKKAK